MAKPQYSTAEYRATKRNLQARMNHDGYLICSEPVCLMPTRMIQPGQAWDLCHDPSGTKLIGPGHAKCNRSEGAKRRERMKRRTWSL